MVGRVSPRPVNLRMTRKCLYAEGAPRHGWDYETGYLKLVANALGATDVELILAELTLAGVVPGMESLIGKKEESIAAAKTQAKVRASA
jgi:FMN-dependent NADH-azoreductase